MITSFAHYFEHQKPNWHIKPRMSETHILVFVTAGSLVFEVDDKPYELVKGDMILIPTGVLRSVRENHPTEGHDMYLFRFLHDGADDGLPMLLSRHPTFIRTSQFEYMKQRFSLVTQQWLRRSAYSGLLCHSMLMEILAYLNEEVDSQNTHGRAYGHVVKLQNYILQHHRRPISVPELAKHIGRTPNYVSSIFHQATGQRVTTYLQQIRIAAACDLLLNAQMTVGEVSDFLGFCEQSYFNKVFKKVTGMMPSNYMNENAPKWKK